MNDSWIIKNDSWITIQIWRRDGKMKGSGHSWEVRTPLAMPQPGGCGQAAQGSLQTLMPRDKWHQFLGQKQDQRGRQNNQGVNKNWETGRGIKQFCSGHKQCVLVTRHTREERRPTGTQTASTGSGAGWRPRSTESQKWKEKSSKKKLSTVPNAAYHR